MSISLQEYIADLKRGPEDFITAFDFETPNKEANRACSIGISVIRGDHVDRSFELLIRPDTYFDDLCISIHGITPNMVANEPEFPDVWKTVAPLFEDNLVIAHNACFDLSVLKRLLFHYTMEHLPVRYADTLRISRKVYGASMPNHKLGTLCSELGIDLDAHHAGSDSLGCAELYLRMRRKAGNLDSFEKEYNFDM